MIARRVVIRVWVGVIVLLSGLAAAKDTQTLTKPLPQPPSQSQSLAEMVHSSWTARDGAPQAVRALAQAPDGTLWIGAAAGLFNFDGRAFNAFVQRPGETPLPPEPVQSVFVAKDGSLWLGLFRSGAARITNGRVNLFADADKEPLGRVTNLVQDADGSVWALSKQKRLVRFRADQQWHSEPTPEATGRIGKFFIDSSNTMWLAQGGRVYRRPLAQDTYIATDVPADLAFGFAEAPDGSVWITDAMLAAARNRIQHVDHQGHLIFQPDDIYYNHDILFAPDRSLILSTQYNGLHRYTAEALSLALQTRKAVEYEEFSTAEGLTSSEARVVLTDADGNLWVGTGRGLDRFRKAKLVRFVGNAPAVRWRMCANKGGTLWIAPLSNAFYKVSGGVASLFEEKLGYITISCGDDGDVWLENTRSYFRLHDGQFSEIPRIPGVPPYSTYALAATADHTLYAGVDAAHGERIWQYRDNQWSVLPGDGPETQSGAVAYLDSKDRLWFGHLDGTVTLPLERRSLSSGNPGVGAVMKLLETSHGMFAGGSYGIAVLRGDGFKMLAFDDEVSTRGIGGMVESGKGDLWLNTPQGIVRVAASEVEKGLGDTGYRMKSDLIREGEFVGTAGEAEFSAAVKDDTGILWFATINGVVRVDPADWRIERRPPVISLLSIASDRVALAESRLVDPRPQSLEIRYLGVNLTAPREVIYRYRLEGFDNGWQDVGHRTEAIYTRLPAGTYTFSVMSSNGDGVWTAPVSFAPFTVLPSFYQTKWFAVMCIVLASILLWLIISFRVRAITRQVRARAEERADERIRIARDLHDTLLQGIQGLLLTFHVASQKISPDDESRTLLDKALSSADRIIIEGRNRVSRLRSEHLSDAELVASLENVCNDLNVNGGVVCEVRRRGGDAALHTHVADEVFNIAREALTNSFRHSQASRIEVEIDYGARFFTLVCRDNGRGFDSQEQDRQGHWGLQGMRERVRKLGGQMQALSAAGKGTEIIVSIPSYRAYPRHSRLAFYLRAIGPHRNRAQ
jgi:signal transduction histidine kinase/ligand-binding sensor domain-containing protein